MAVGGFQDSSFVSVIRRKNEAYNMYGSLLLKSWKISKSFEDSDDGKAGRGAAAILYMCLWEGGGNLLGIAFDAEVWMLRILRLCMQGIMVTLKGPALSCPKACPARTRPIIEADDRVPP